MKTKHIFSLELVLRRILSRLGIKVGEGGYEAIPFFSNVSDRSEAYPGF
jgi:hypothetical protein